MKKLNAVSFLIITILILSFFSLHLIDKNIKLNSKIDSIQAIENQNKDANVIINKTVQNKEVSQVKPSVVPKKEIEKEEVGNTKSVSNIGLTIKSKDIKLNTSLFKPIKSKSSVIIPEDSLNVLNETLDTSKSEFEFLWQLDTTYSEGNGRKLVGITKVDFKDSIYTSYLKEEELEINIKSRLVQGRENNKTVYYIQTYSDYPNLTFTNLDSKIEEEFFINSITNNKKKRKLSLNPSLFIGIGFSDSKTPHPVIGFGLSLSLLKK